MLTSEHQRFSVSSVELLTKGREETVVSSTENGTTYSDVLYRGCNQDIVCSEENAISLASMHLLIEDTTKNYPAGIAFDDSGALYYINIVDGLIKHLNPNKTDSVTIQCIGKNGSDPCQFAPGFAHEGGFVKLFPRGKEDESSKEGGISKGCIVGIAIGKKMIAVSDPGNNRIQCFYRHSLQLSYIIDSDNLRSMGIAVNGNDFTPWDCVFDSCDNLYVIDVNPPKESEVSSRLLCISRRGHHAIDIGNNELKHPVSLFLNSSDTLYVLDRNRPAVLKRKIDINSSWLEIVSLKGICQNGFVPIGVAVDKNNFIYVGEYGNGGEPRFYIWNSEGAYTGYIRNQFGNCRRIIASHQNSMYAECENSGVIQLNGKNGYVKNGVIYTRIFDSLYPETRWHRITIDAQIEKDCNLGIEYFTWNPDPEKTLITRKVNPVWIPLCTVQGSDQIQPDSLLNNANGRFIVFKITLCGNGESSPLVKKIRITFPHRSYLRYLPAIYQEDPIGLDITDRFLSVFEAFNMEIEEQIATISRLFDPQSTTEEFLSWLGSWLGILRDENWSEKQFRELLSQSYELFKIRGTSECLKKILSIYTGGSIRIIEHYQYRRPMVLGADLSVGVNSIVGRKFNQPLVLEESSTIGNFLLIEELEPPETPFLADAYDFTVIVDMPDPQEKQIVCIRRLIEHEKPAHTRYCLRISGLGQPRIGTAMLGVDTKLTHAHNPMKIGTPESVLGDSLKAGTRYPIGGMYESNSKVGIDTYLH